MSNPSNLYAEKVYSEHPTILWALDDQVDYITLITEAQRNIPSLWSVTGGSGSAGSSLTGEPFINSYTTDLEGDVPVSSTGTISCVSPNLFNFSDLNNVLGSFSIGTYFYSNSLFLQAVEIGFEYTDTTTSQIIKNVKTFQTTAVQAWSFVSGTFDIPNENTNFRIVINFIYTDGGSTSSDYQFYVNGITAGQWSEEFNTFSLGLEPISLPSTIALDVDAAVEADAYGLGGESGYYIVNDNKLVARNSGVPMVFGANGITTITPNSSNKPSLIIPGKGFLNKLGQFKEYTLEFWIRINSNAYEPKKIFGPISSSDGLYVESGFLTLVIGNKFLSHFIGEWFRDLSDRYLSPKAREIVMSDPKLKMNFFYAAYNGSGFFQKWGKKFSDEVERGNSNIENLREFVLKLREEYPNFLIQRSGRKMRNIFDLMA
jgi:hypothetical protein